MEVSIFGGLKARGDKKTTKRLCDRSIETDDIEPMTSVSITQQKRTTGFHR